MQHRSKNTNAPLNAPTFGQAMTQTSAQRFVLYIQLRLLQERWKKWPKFAIQFTHVWAAIWLRRHLS
jgi:hypothetical protein